MKLVLATRNQGKIQEMTGLLSRQGLTVLSLADYPEVGDIIEDGTTFTENAIKKARHVAESTGEVALADDSGLAVDYLNGEPGVYSARFAGAEKDDRANNEKLLRLLAGAPPEQRAASFHCVIAIAEPGGRVYTVEGVCPGRIITGPRGCGGFGYDPIFYLPDYGKTFAELDIDTKNRISHRGKALNKAISILNSFISPV